MSLKMLTSVDSLLAVVKDDSQYGLRLKELKDHISHYMAAVEAVTKLSAVDEYVQAAKATKAQAEETLRVAKAEAQKIKDSAEKTEVVAKAKATEMLHEAKLKEAAAFQADQIASEAAAKNLTLQEQLEQDIKRVKAIEADYNAKLRDLNDKHAQLREIFLK